MKSEVCANGNESLSGECGSCESCDRRFVHVIRFNTSGVGLKFAVCESCLRMALRLVPSARAEEIHDFCVD